MVVVSGLRVVSANNMPNEDKEKKAESYHFHGTKVWQVLPAVAGPPSSPSRRGGREALQKGRRDSIAFRRGKEPVGFTRSATAAGLPLVVREH